MGITTEQYQKIMRFLDAEMEAPEMEAFEKELVSNPEMRVQLDFEQSLRNDFALQNITTLPDTLAENENIQPHVMKGGITSMRIWLAVGAAAITAVMLFIIFEQKQEKIQDITKVTGIDTIQKRNSVPDVSVNTPEPKRNAAKPVDLALLFKQYYKKDRIPEHYPLYLAEALMDYENGNYKTMQKLNLNNLPQTRSTGETDSKENILQLGHYYKGLAFLQTNNTKEAIINLNWALNNQPTHTLHAKAQWYLALAYLKENNKEKTAELCRSIISNKKNDTLIKNAEKILATLEK